MHETNLGIPLTKPLISSDDKGDSAFTLSCLPSSSSFPQSPTSSAQQGANPVENENPFGQVQAHAEKAKSKTEHIPSPLTGNPFDEDTATSNPSGNVLLEETNTEGANNPFENDSEDDQSGNDDGNPFGKSSGASKQSASNNPFDNAAGGSFNPFDM